MKWISTRRSSPAVPFIDALFAGTAPDGGLYFPERFEPLPPATRGRPSLRRSRGDRIDRRRASPAGRDYAGGADAARARRARLPDSAGPGDGARVGAGAVSRADARLQGRRRPGAGAAAAPLHRRHPADDPRRHLGRHRQRRRAGVPRRARHPRGRPLPGRTGHRRPGSPDGVARRQHHGGVGARDLRRLPAPRQAGVCRRRAAEASVADAGELDQPGTAAAAGVLLLRAGAGSGGDAGRSFRPERELRQPDGRADRQADRPAGPRISSPRPTSTTSCPSICARGSTSRARRCGRWPTRWTSARRATSNACGRSTTTTSIACGRTSKARRSRTGASSRKSAGSTASAGTCSIRTAPSPGSVCSRRSTPIRRRPGVFLATAHPAKFREVVEPAIGQPVELPATLAAALARPRHSVPLQASYPELVDLVLQTV